MSQRESGYQRKPLDQYEAPAWVTRALIPHLPEFTGKVWEPACSSGKMVAALRQAGFDVVGSDITQGVDFLGQAPETGVSAIITNPPYALAREFIERALHFDDILVCRPGRLGRRAISSASRQSSPPASLVMCV
jgi:tRNA G10  N-methylase Trm11